MSMSGSPDLPDFVTTFLDGSIEQLRHYKGSLTVHIPARYPYWTDLTPLLSYLLQAPDSNIEFICGAMINECTKDFINIFNNAWASLKATMSGTLSPHQPALCGMHVQIPLECEDQLVHEVEIRLVFGKSDRREWMDGRGLWGAGKYLPAGTQESLESQAEVDILLAGGLRSRM
jgi:hypothetical protein